MIDYPLESFVFYRSFRDAIEEMSDENKLATLLGICDYALYGVEPTLNDAMARAVFTVARPSIDANKNRRNNGKKGGRPPKKPLVSDFKNQWFSKSESTESVSVSGTEADTGEKADKPPTRSRFVPPTVDEIRAYCGERGNGIDAESFVDYYQARGWKLGKGQNMKDWRAVVRTWERREKKDPGEAGPPAKRGSLTVGEDGEEVVDFG